MSQRVADWLAGIEKHYASLDEFDDARTVRIMRGFVMEFMSEHNRIVATIKDPDGRAYYEERFSPDTTRAKAQLEILDDWLAKRGLTP